MGILKLELPIFDSCIEPLLENDYDRFLTKIINKWNIKITTPKRLYLPSRTFI